MKTQSVDGPRVACRIALAAAILPLAIFMCAPKSAVAQQVATPSQSPGVSGQKSGQIFIPVTLTAGLDSKKRKVGDEVIVKTAAAVHLTDGTVIPRGEKVVGHVTEAKARSAGDSESLLAIVFDKINLPEGKAMAIKGTMQAVAPRPDDSSGGGIGYGDLKQMATHASEGGGASTAPLLDDQSVGVHGIKDLQLTADGVLKSDGKTVKLEYGSQVMVRAMVGS